MLRIAVTGGTGFLGGHVVRALAARGDAVTVLSRDPMAAAERLPFGVIAAPWGATNDPVKLPQSDVVLHLAGEPAVGRRWTEAMKRDIRESRVHGAEVIVNEIAKAAERPRVLVSASGVGYYGARDDAPVDELGSPGDDFLATVCVAWERAAEKARTLGVRVVLLRFGVILGKGGGALPVMALPFRLFAGGPLGKGTQVFSWIHLEDAVRAVLLAVDDENVSGPMNVTTPNPVTNDELSRAMGRALGRPSSLRVPALALKARFGEGATPMLTGQRAVPTALAQHGFEWRYPTIDSALEEALG